MRDERLRREMRVHVDVLTKESLLPNHSELGPLLLRLQPAFPLQLPLERVPLHARERLVARRLPAPP